MSNKEIKTKKNKRTHQIHPFDQDETKHLTELDSPVHNKRVGPCSAYFHAKSPEAQSMAWAWNPLSAWLGMAACGYDPTAKRAGSPSEKNRRR